MSVGKILSANIKIKINLNNDKVIGSSVTERVWHLSRYRFDLCGSYAVKK